MICPNKLKKISGKTILEHSISVFERNGSIDEITVLAHSEFVDFWKKNLILSIPRQMNSNSKLSAQMREQLRVSHSGGFGACLWLQYKIDIRPNALMH
jgi:hypothetical protein